MFTVLLRHQRELVVLHHRLKKLHHLGKCEMFYCISLINLWHIGLAKLLHNIENICLPRGVKNSLEYAKCLYDVLWLLISGKLRQFLSLRYFMLTSSQGTWMRAILEKFSVSSFPLYSYECSLLSIKVGYSAAECQLFNCFLIIEWVLVMKFKAYRIFYCWTIDGCLFCACCLSLSQHREVDSNGLQLVFLMKSNLLYSIKVLESCRSLSRCFGYINFLSMVRYWNACTCQGNAWQVAASLYQMLI